MRRTRWLILAMVIGGIVLLLSCGLGAAAMQQGFVTPPDIKLEFGGMRVISGISTLPDCARLLAPGCSSLHPEPTVWIYTVWLLWGGDARLQENTHIFRLFSTHLKR